MAPLTELESKLGIRFFDYQLEAFDHWVSQGPQRVCLYFRTGAGKSITAMSLLALRGHDVVVVIAPPVTHQAWEELGVRLGIEVQAMSHATFRMSKTKLVRSVPVIADEFHLFGGQQGMGWKKLDRLAAGMTAPMILCSATPNYNDAERCYCVQHILDPISCRGGFLQFIYQNCTTEQNPFGQMPKVTGFLRHRDAEHYLSELPNVYFLADEVVYDIVDVPAPSSVPEEFELYGLNRRTSRVMASRMEKDHHRRYLNLMTQEGLIREPVYDLLTYLTGQAATPVILFCYSSRVAEALHKTCQVYRVDSRLVTGDTKPKDKQEWISQFRRGELDVLIGTATLATGTDGLDKVCDTLIIVHDTQDDASRRQMVGRILPRGLDTDASGKQIYRLVF